MPLQLVPARTPHDSRAGSSLSHPVERRSFSCHPPPAAAGLERSSPPTSGSRPDRLRRLRTLRIALPLRRQLVEKRPRAQDLRGRVGMPELAVEVDVVPRLLSVVRPLIPRDVPAFKEPVVAYLCQSSGGNLIIAPSFFAKAYPEGSYQSVPPIAQARSVSSISLDTKTAASQSCRVPCLNGLLVFRRDGMLF
jgi:hypothetical protein